MPISAKSLAKLDRRVVSKDEFLRRGNQPRSSPSQPVEIPFKMIGGVPVVEVILENGEKVPMIFDTGASMSLITSEVVLDQKISVLPKDVAKVKIQGVLGAEEGRLGMLDSFNLGGWKVIDYPFIVRTYEYRFSRAHLGPRPPNNVIGFDLCLLYDCSYLSVDYVRSKITFGFDKPYQTEVGKSVRGARMKVSNKQPLILVSSKGQQWIALVDTGSFNGIEINELVAQGLGVQDMGRKIANQHLLSVGGTLTTEAANMRKVTLPSVTLLGEKYPEIEADIAPGPLRVGSLFLKNSVVTFDFRRKRLWIERQDSSKQG